MIKILINLTVTLILCSAVFAKTEKHSHRAHNHGAAELAIAFDGNRGSIEFTIPGESIFGFEHEAKSEQDKKQAEGSLVQLDRQISEFLIFDPSLRCQIAKTAKHAMQKDGSHLEVLAKFNVTCEKSPVGTALVFNFQKQFPKLKTVKIQIIADNVQKAIEAKKNNTSIDLK